MTEQLTENIFEGFQGTKQEIIPLLQKVQKDYGYLPMWSLSEISKFCRIPESKVYSVATFYTQFRFTPIGRNHIMLCRGTACHIRGAPRILKRIKNKLSIDEGETTPDMGFSLETVACVGACGMAPNMVINDRTYGRLTEKKVLDILNDLKSQDKDE